MHGIKVVGKFVVAVLVAALTTVVSARAQQSPATNPAPAAGQAQPAPAAQAAQPAQPTQPAQPAQPPQAPAPSNPEGKALIGKVVKAMGGVDKLSQVHALRLKASVDAKTPQGEFNLDLEELEAFPDRMWQKAVTPMGDIVIVTTPSVGFMAAPQGTQDLPTEQKDEGVKELRRNEVFIAQHLDDPKYTFTATGTAKVGNVDAQILDVDADGALVRWYVDPQSGRILRRDAHIVDMGGPADQVLDFSDWKEFAGISFPTKARITREGQDGGSVEVEQVDINPTVDEKLFVRPAD